MRRRVLPLAALLGALCAIPALGWAGPAAGNAPSGNATAATAGSTSTGDAAPAVPAPGEGPDRPFVYQVRGNGVGMSGTAQYEVGFGTRATRFFGEKGVEQGIRLRFQPWSFLSFEGWGGLLVQPDGDTRGAGAFEVNARALRQDHHYIDLHLGAGYLYDYRGRHVMRVRAGVGRRFGRLDLQLGSALEIPLSGEGDEVDVMVGAAATYRITRWFHQGLEVGLEDLEGFWEPNESEGGAKVLFGPTAYFTFRRRFEVRVNASAVYAHLANQTGLAAASQPEWGFMGRVMLAYTFR